MYLKRLLTGLALSAFLAAQTLPALAKTVDILNTVPLDISGYDISKNLPDTLSSADTVVEQLNQTDNLLVHMELIRRSNSELNADEQAALLEKLHSRHRANHNDVHKFFDHGYAQLVLEDNKSGLFFLRKADDRLKNQFSALAYAMAQAEVDINQEEADPDTMTTRKLDVIFLMKDAVKRDAAEHQPGFWPAYLQVVEKLAPLSAYRHFTDDDFSLFYVPYGNRIVPMGMQSTAIPLRTEHTPGLLSNALTTSCDPEIAEPEAMSTGTETDGLALSQRQANFAGETAMIRFFSTEDPATYKVNVTDHNGAQLLGFTSKTRGNIVEDLDGDGIYEIVVRQYEQSPYQPVIVYRYTPCGFRLDKEVFSYFQK